MPRGGALEPHRRATTSVLSMWSSVGSPFRDVDSDVTNIRYVISNAMSIRTIVARTQTGFAAMMQRSSHRPKPYPSSLYPNSLRPKDLVTR